MDPTTPAEHDRAVEFAYRALSGRDRTVAEMRAWLERKQLAPAAIEYAVGELAAAGYLDDARFAARFAEDKRAIERWGSERIERDLRRRGVAPEVVEGVLGATERHSELATALELLTAKLPPPADDRERDRAWRLLIRKGYEPELAYDAVRAHTAAQPPPTSCG